MIQPQQLNIIYDTFKNNCYFIHVMRYFPVFPTPIFNKLKHPNTKNINIQPYPLTLYIPAGQIACLPNITTGFNQLTITEGALLRKIGLEVIGYKKNQRFYLKYILTLLVSRGGICPPFSKSHRMPP